MEYIIIGGDARFGWLARLLRQRGARVGTLWRETVPGVPALDDAALGETRIAVVNCPPRLHGAEWDLGALLSKLPEGARLFACGPRHPEAAHGLIDLWADEALLRENAELTAEGAIASAMRASDTALRDVRCLVVGWGRIGQALTERLVALGAAVTVASRSEAGRNRAVERGAESVPTGMIQTALPGHRLVFNTAPGMVFDAGALAWADADAMLIDLASPPYGIALHAAWARGLRAWREPGLPGRYCPRSAAQAILKAMDRIEGGNRHD